VDRLGAEALQDREVVDVARVARFDDEADELKLDETQVRQLDEDVKKAKRDLKETIWRTYKAIMLLGKDAAFSADVTLMGLSPDGPCDKCPPMARHQPKYPCPIAGPLAPWPPASAAPRVPLEFVRFVPAPA